MALKPKLETSYSSNDNVLRVTVRHGYVARLSPEEAIRTAAFLMRWAVEEQDNRKARRAFKKASRSALSKYRSKATTSKKSRR